MFKTFIILKYFHIQTSSMKRKYPTLIVRIFLVSARTHSIPRYIHIQILCVHKRNVLRFLQDGTYHVVVRGGSHFCQSPQGGGGGGQEFFIEAQGMADTSSEKNYQNSPAPPPPKKKRTFPKIGSKQILHTYRLLGHEKRCFCKLTQHRLTKNTKIVVRT